MQEAPALSTDSSAQNKVCAYIAQQHEHFADQERNVGLPRAEIVDDRVHVALYLLPPQADIAALDTNAITTLGALLPVVPVMCKVRHDRCVQVLSLHCDKSQGAPALPWVTSFGWVASRWLGRSGLHRCSCPMRFADIDTGILNVCRRISSRTCWRPRTA